VTAGLYRSNCTDLPSCEAGCAEEVTAGLYRSNCTDLPSCEAGCAEEVTAGLYPDVLAVLCTDLAELERASHLTVQLVLLLGHLKKKKEKKYKNHIPDLDGIISFSSVFTVN
jgi:hypothetical protein